MKYPTVLLVSDDDAIVREISGILGQTECRVVIHRHSGDTLMAFYNTPSAFDLVILCEDMADMAGSVLSARLRRIRGRLPIIMLTQVADNDVESIVRSIDQHQLFVRRPVGREELIEAVKHMLQR